MLPTASCREIGLLCNMGACLADLTSCTETSTNEQELTPEADIVNVHFTKSVIASKAAFTYEEAQLRKDDGYALSFRQFEFKHWTDRYWPA